MLTFPFVQSLEMFPMATPKREHDPTDGPQSAGPSSSSSANNWSLDHFDVGRKLGEGRFGKIYLAREKSTKYAVVLKCISKEAVMHFDLLHQIRREIELHMFCRHRHILRMLAYFWDDERIFLVLEHADGGDLYNALSSFPHRRVPDGTAAVIVAQLCSAVKYLHHHRILHRDVKPENILLKKGVVKLADFTWAVLCHEHNPSTRNPSRRSTVCGTLDYMSPEIIGNGEYDSSVDCWAVGALTYELLLGEPPFVERSEGDTCRRIRAGTFTLPPFVGSLARDFISRLLDVDPSRRMTMVDALKHPWLAEARASEHALRGRSESLGQPDGGLAPVTSSSTHEGMTRQSIVTATTGAAHLPPPANSTSFSAVSTSTIVQGSNMSLLNRSSRPQTAAGAISSAAEVSQQNQLRLGQVSSSRLANSLLLGPQQADEAQHVSVERALDMAGSDDDDAKLLSKVSTAEGVTFPEVSSLREDDDEDINNRVPANTNRGGDGDRRTPTPASGEDGTGGVWRDASLLEMTAISVSNNVSAADATMF